MRLIIDTSRVRTNTGVHVCLLFVTHIETYKYKIKNQPQVRVKPVLVIARYNRERESGRNVLNARQTLNRLVLTEHNKCAT